jgi:hypothetical protein
VRPDPGGTRIMDGNYAAYRRLYQGLKFVRDGGITFAVKN